MKAISNVFFMSLVFLTSCSWWGNSKGQIDDKPVLSALVQAETKSRIDFSRHVKPILEERCVWCHDGSDDDIPYSLSSREKAFQAKRIVPGKPRKSLLFVAAGGEHPALGDSGKEVRIAPSDLAVLERWIVSGAVWPEGTTGQLERR